MILADDLGYGDLGVTGCPDIETPNLDQLAAEGVRFSHAYANGPVCTPTRVALLTGRYQQRTGMDRVIFVGERELGLTLDALLLPELLKQQGYTTGIMGKWHLGFPKEYFPNRRGFDTFFGFLAGNIDYFAHTDRYENHDLWHNETEIRRDGQYMTELIGDESVEFIRQHRDEPFFLYVPFNAPHDPFQGPGDAASAGNQPLTRQTYRTRAKFIEMVESMDLHIGRILDEIAQQDLEQDTVVFFMSDNGGLTAVARNDPFRGQKTTLWEGGIRSPLLVRWKGRLEPARVIDDMVAAMDLHPTVLEIAGVELPPNLDGVSLMGVLEGKVHLQRDTLYFHYQDPSPDQPPQQAMVQRGWKYLRNREGQEYLFHLAEDASESSDRSAEQPERLERMKALYEAWLEDVRRDAPHVPPYDLTSEK